jgi:cytochrome c biogenesis protein CcmG/thiol:disulfide interchange protein DsbE
LRAAERHDVSVIGVLYQDTAESARDFLARYGDGGWPNLVDPGGRTAIDFGVIAPPETFLVDSNGIVRAKFVGPLTDEALDELLAPILAAEADR